MTGTRGAVDNQVTVALTTYEFRYAATVGISQHVRALANGWQTRAGQPAEESLLAHILGACGECAAAKGLGLYWPGDRPPDRGRPDVGPYEVRTTRPNRRTLVVRPDPPPDRRYLAVIAITDLCYELAGWCTGTDARRYPLTTSDPKRSPAHWVPYGDLRPVGRQP